ncbi:histone chaperone NAP1 Ecym_5221 [Eremothecium cymbalariae DBVPG|uniref:Nucleosome assembly protein n=1 Tax=Eremothecium cymbalariae (strain CBS 270.75 / DBVPG 7215 / KCTC 17166 / NRRL Y-17582) TaxID=931890 RepID=I6ND47_ERECY|nr:hypothetical protein Ecym_5221 [Eremothecium cymbalariae DBVPG\
MASPIKTKNQIDGAPTPQNTPASILKDSYLKNGNPLLDAEQQQSIRVPPTINEEEINAALAKNPQLLATIQGKLGSLLGQDSGYISSLPKRVKERIFALKKLQQDIFQLEKQFQLEMFELEHKYLQKYAPLHDRRAALVKGTSEPTAAEIEIGKEIDAENERSVFSQGEEAEDNDYNDNEHDEETDQKGIPSFWLTTLENLPMISQTITDRDAEVLDYLTNVSMEYLTEGKPGFKLLFEFEKNPFFSDNVLTKTYYYQPELGYSGDFIYDHAEGTQINWASTDLNVTVLVEKRKQRNKTTKQVRTIEKITPIESFFNFFDPPSVPAAEDKPSDTAADLEEDGEDEDEVSELESRLALDYAIGEEIKDKLIPRAVDWFTGIAREFDYDDDDEDEDDYDDDDYDDEDDNEPIEEEDEEQHNHAAEDSEEDDFAKTVKDEQPSECKQS